MATSSNTSTYTYVKIDLRTDIKCLKDLVERAVNDHGESGILHVNANTSITWQQLFQKINIDITDDRMYVIKNDAGTVVSKITDALSHHISKYKNIRDVYVARIMRKTVKVVYKPPIMKRISKKKKNTPKISNSKETRGRKPKQLMPAATQHIANTMNTSPSVENVTGIVSDGISSRSTSVTSVPKEETVEQNIETSSVFQRDGSCGIRIENVESHANLNMDDFKRNVLISLDRAVSNSILLKMKEEFDDVNRRGQWLELVDRIPRLGNLMSVIFSDANFTG